MPSNFHENLSSRSVEIGSNRAFGVVVGVACLIVSGFGFWLGSAYWPVWAGAAAFRLRAEYLLSNGRWYAKPLVDLDVTHVSLDGTTESGTGGVPLKVRGSDQTVFSATPMLELGAQFGNPNGTLVRPYVKAGATIFDDPDFALLANFEGAPSGVGPFRIATNTDDVVGNVGVGMDVIGVEGASFRLYYEGRFGDTVTDHAGGIKGSWNF